MAGMWVDYYEWALALGVGWQGWNNVSYCAVTIVVSGFPYAAQSLRCLLVGRCV